MPTIPPLDNGLPRVDWVADTPSGVPEFSALVAEDAPIFLLATDAGLELVVEPGPIVDGRQIGVTVRAVRRADPLATFTVPS